MPQSLTLAAQYHEIPPSNHLKAWVSYDKLNFDMHVDNICLSASRKLYVLKGLSKFLDEGSCVLIVLMYKSFVLSTFSYSLVTWIFCGIRNNMKLEKLQEGTLRFVLREFASIYDELLKDSNFPPLLLYRLKLLAIEVYECVNHLNPLYLNDPFIRKRYNMTSRDKDKVGQPKMDPKRFGYVCIMGRNYVMGQSHGCQLMLNALTKYGNSVTK